MCSFFVHSFSVYFCFLSLHNPRCFKNLKRLCAGIPRPSPKMALVPANSGDTFPQLSLHSQDVKGRWWLLRTHLHNRVLVYGEFFKSSTKVLCNNPFVSMLFLERRFQSCVGWACNRGPGGKRAPQGPGAQGLCAGGREAPCAEQDVPPKQVLLLSTSS